MRLAARLDQLELRPELRCQARAVVAPHRQRVVQMFARNKVPLRMDIELPTIESIKAFVEMKQGVAIVPRMCVESEIRHGLLRDAVIVF